MSLYRRYKTIKSATIEEQREFINELMIKYPKIIKYLFNRIDTCFGEHKVYLVHMKVNGVDMIKIGYTKNDIIKRFGEKRYKGQNELEIIEIIRENTLQAKGAVTFENKLKELTKDYNIDSNLTLPGKGEFMDITFKDKIVELYDSFYDFYIEIEGLKSPN